MRNVNDEFWIITVNTSNSMNMTNSFIIILPPLSSQRGISRFLITQFPFQFSPPFKFLTHQGLRPRSRSLSFVPSLQGRSPFTVPSSHSPNRELKSRNILVDVTGRGKMKLISLSLSSPSYFLSVFLLSPFPFSHLSLPSQFKLFVLII